MSSNANIEQMSEVKQVEMCVDEQNLDKLVKLISNGSVSTIGIKTGHFEKETNFFIQYVHFDLEDGKLANPRIHKGNLLLDLWFHSHNQKLAQGVLQERNRCHPEGMQQDVLLTVVITKLDYISTHRERFYW